LVLQRIRVLVGWTISTDKLTTQAQITVTMAVFAALSLGVLLWDVAGKIVTYLRLCGLG